MSGINIPWVYVGMKFSTFCWHFEDLMLPSINYSHYGKPKLWYAVPESYRDKFDRAVKEKCTLLFKQDPNILFDVTTMISPAYLLSKGIKIYKTLQRQGEYIVTYPGSYHGGFSTGLNIGEAVNFATKEWLNYGIKCQGIYRQSKERIPVFPIEWVLTENIRNLHRIRIDKESLFEIKNAFEKFVEEELKSRSQMETLISKFHGRNGQKQLKLQIEMLEDRDTVDEDAYQCKYCTDLCYFSMIKCKGTTCVKNPESESQKDSSEKEPVEKFVSKYSKRKQMSKQEKRASALSSQPDSEQYCIHHLGYCGCTMDNYTLVYRFSTVELQQMLKAIQKACQDRDSSVEEIMPLPEITTKLIPKLKPTAIVFNR